MRRHATLIVALSVIAARESAPLAPSPVAPQQTPSPVTGLEIIGPSTLPPGATAQFTATATRLDGSREDVTTRATWTILPSTASNVLSISQAGVATAHKSGQASVGVVFAGFGGGVAQRVLVLPPGTFMVSGVVIEGGSPVADAQVVVTSGPATGLAATTDWSGFYTLWGVEGQADVRVSRNGYQPQSQRLSVSGNQVLNFDLTLAGSRHELGGNYNLTLSVAAQCSGGFPAEFRTRTYAAHITQRHAQLSVELSGPEFALDGGSGNRFSGRSESDRVTFSIDPFDEGFEPIRERLSTGAILSVTGRVVAIATSVGYSGTLSGRIEISHPGPLPSSSRCVAESHGVTLSR